METTQWDDNFTVDDYKDLVKKLYNGEIEVSSDITAMPETEITVNDYGSIKKDNQLLRIVNAIINHG